MKTKLFLSSLLLTLIIMTSCQKDNNPFNPTADFAPPSWIIGEWHDGTDFNNYTFSSDNVILNSPAASTSINFKEAYASATVTEDINSSSEYKFTVTLTGVNQTCRFVKVSTSTLNYYLTTSGMTIGPFLLTKQ